MPGDPTLQITGTTTVQVVDATPPTSPTIVAPTDGSTTTNPSPPISGTAEPGSTVAVKEGGTTICAAVADANGNWTCTPTSPLPDGEHDITAAATDTTGNISPATTTTFRVYTSLSYLPMTGFYGYPEAPAVR